MSSPSPTPIVGVGASAGGLEAFRAFLRAIPPRPGLAFVLVQHLDPAHETQLPQLLEDDCSLPIFLAEPGMPIHPDTVYMAPSGHLAQVAKETLELHRNLSSSHQTMPIDHLFHSLAEERGPRAAGVVLSGSGSDGTLGLRAIRALGGLALVQDPETAQHEGMPLSAIHAHTVDQVLPPQDMPPVLAKLLLQPEGEPFEHEDHDLDRILRLLETRTHFTPSKYKLSTVRRRILRRMHLSRLGSLEGYLQLLRDSSDEVQTLVRDMLIGVTDFFRDGEAFQALAHDVLPGLFERARARGEDLRVWVTACASGEEAYSVAMLLDRHNDPHKPVNVSLFATDLSEDALEVARQGVYSPAVVQNVPKSLLDKHFEHMEDGRYRARRALRDRISFARHDLLEDPPFSRLDLLCCRNVLIYLTAQSQRQIFDTFHFALRPEGCLMLGSSESVNVASHLFQPISKTWRLYRRAYSKPGAPAGWIQRTAGPHDARSVHDRPRPSAAGAARRALLQQLDPSLVLTRDHQVVFVHGDLSAYLAVPEGELDADVFRLIREPLRPRLRAALYKTIREGEVARVDFLDLERRTCSVTIRPPNDEGLITMTFRPRVRAEVGGGSPATEEDFALQRQLEEELLATKEDLHNTIEELETTNEELRSANEEALSMNEELQSANEELESSSEEMRSLNEELVSVNEQLKTKIQELEETTDDLSNLLSSTRIATVFLDQDLLIRRYTAAATSMLWLVETDLGRPIDQIKGDCEDAQLVEDARRVLSELTPVERELEAHDGRWFARRVLPYRTEDHRIAGVVLTYTEISVLKRFSEALKVRERQQSALKDLGVLTLSELDLETCYRAAARLLAYTLPIDRAAVFLREEPGVLTCCAASGFADGLVGDQLRVSPHSLAGYVLLHGDTITSADLSTELRFELRDDLADRESRSALGVLIRQAEQVYGVITVHSRTDYAFGPHDVDVVHNVANMLANATQRARIEAQLRESEAMAQRNLQELEAVYTHAQVGLAVLDPDLRYVRVNQQLADMNRRPIGEHLGRTVHEVAPVAAPLLQQVVETLQPVEDVEVQGAVPPAPHQQRTWRVNYYPMLVAGELTAINCTIVEVTALRRAEEARTRLIAELNHRVKNTLSSVLGIATRCAEDAASIDEFAERLRERVLALARTHEALSEEEWAPVELRLLLRRILQPFLDDQPVEVEGDPLEVVPRQAIPLGMILYELATNASKHGALNRPDGSLRVRWSLSGGALQLRWSERGLGVLRPPEQEGYGLWLIRGATRHDLGGRAEFELHPDGLDWVLEFNPRTS